MIGDFLKKQREKKKQKDLVVLMIKALLVSDEQKKLYLEALEILDSQGFEKLYKNLTIFTEELEIKELEEINKNNFSQISGMRKKEAKDKQEELNSFSFLINNL